MVSAWDNNKPSGIVVGGEGSVHFMELTRHLLDGISDRGWVEGEPRDQLFS